MFWRAVAKVAFRDAVSFSLAAASGSIELSQKIV